MTDSGQRTSLPARQLAQQQWARARAAAVAGTNAWQNGKLAHEAAHQ
jgi:hypothetical protein